MSNVPFLCWSAHPNNNKPKTFLTTANNIKTAIPLLVGATKYVPALYGL